jgi:hypothetical protein
MSTDSATASAGEPETVAELQAAADALDRAEERVAEFGEAELEEVADAHEEFTDILARYEEPATGDGDFQKFIEFQSQIADFVERLPDDLLLRETFEECDELLQQRRLRERDFEEVRSNLDPVADLAGRLDERREAQEAYRSARNRVRHRLGTVRERIDDLERVKRLGDADLDAPTERLREPIEAYNAAVTEAFETFRQEAPAREVLALVETAQRFPVIDVRAPPADLREYLRDSEVGEESIPQLLEYAEYSRSKLDHYVADPGALKTAVRPHTTYLRRLDAEPLTVGWPPPSAERLQYHCREAERVVNRFAPDVVESLRAVKRLPKTTDYARLREGAVARAELGAEQRERLKSGAVAEDLADLRGEREALEDALEEFPER